MKLPAVCCMLTGSLLVGLCVGFASGEPDAGGTADQPPAADAKSNLSRLGQLVGEWRGIGQPRRGSRTGAWAETSAWVWDFKTGPALVGTIEDGQLVESARLTWDSKTGCYVLAVKPPAGDAREYRGQWADGELIVTTATKTEQQRVTVRFPNEKRTVLLFEQQSGSATVFSRVAEVGYTRKGETIAVAAGGPECIVTGGKGTMPVEFQGQTYYVCCTGCEQAFRDDPAAIIREYQRQLSQRKAERSR